jgi:hypothetical protein
MDHEVVYNLLIEFPINQETTKLYSMNKDMTDMAIRHAVSKIKHIIRKEGFISLERIMKILEFRACYDTPHIFFDTLDTYRFANNTLSLGLEFSFELDSIFDSKPKKPSLKLVNNEESNEDDEKWSTNATETSGSEENGKT